MNKTFVKATLVAFILCTGISVFAESKPKTKEVLITAFGPYGGRNENPATFVMQEMMTQVSKIKNINFTFQLLRVSYGCVDSFNVAHSFDKYDLILMMGLYPESSTIRVETIGRNYSCEYKDVDSVARPGAIKEKAPKQIRLQQDYIDKIEKFINSKKAPMIMSTDAGDYVCNYLIYTMRYLIAKIDINKPVLFMHVADTLTYKYIMKDADQAKHILNLIKYMLK